MNLEKLMQIIKSKGFKITKPREAILTTLICSKDNLLSADKILKNSKIQCENINMTTVYRNLEILESLNLTFKVLSDNGIALYKLTCNNEHHHHLICKHCGKIQVIDYCPINDLIQISKDNNFKLTEHKIELYGYCKDCKYI